MTEPDVAALRDHLHPLTGAPPDHDALLDAVGDARIVLLGEASHGTREFYAERAAITRRLVEERGFDAVAVEADWPDAYRVGCFTRGRGGDRTAEDALGDFARFPRWMWRNRTVEAFVEELRALDADVGFYGLDLYSLHRSIDAVLGYLDDVDPGAAARARERYGCFEHFGGDEQLYGYRVSSGYDEPCEDDVVAQLVELRERATDALRAHDGDTAFFAEQNARLVVGAEEYYRAMFRGSVASWNLRDTHMADTLDRLLDHLGPASKVVVWAHNSHLGDARATGMGERGEYNLGQLARQRHGDAVFGVGFTTHTGTVTAADAWDLPGRAMRVNPSLAGSYEAALHAVGSAAFGLDLTEPAVAEVLRGPQLERFIGVIYRPRTERASHYVDARLPDQFDWLVHFDGTHAVEPLDDLRAWAGEEVPRTYPPAV